MSENNIKRKTYLDLLRVLACCFVIFNHCEGFELYRTATVPSKIIYLLFSIISTIAVPLFFMISGALLLEKQEDYKTVFKKRVLKTFVILVIVEFSMYCLNYFKAIIKDKVFVFSFYEFIKAFSNLDMPGFLPYWFLYSYLGYLIILPLLQKIVRVLDDNDIRIIMLVRLVLEVILPTLLLLLSSFGYIDISINKYFIIPIVMTDNIFYPIIGYYLDKHIDTRNNYKDIILFVLIVIMAILCGNAFNNINLFRYLIVCLVFVFAKGCASRIKNTKFINYVEKISGLTLGIYIIDPFLFSSIKTPIINMLNSIMSPLLSSIVWVFMSVAIGGFVTFLVRKEIHRLKNSRIKV